MSIKTVDRKLLWGRSANRCSWPDCDTRLTWGVGSEESDLLAGRGVVLGEEAHIRSRETTGPRHDPMYPESSLDTYANLILLCPTHHSLIDKDAGKDWPIEHVEEMKLAHETVVDNALSSTDLLARDLDERVAARIEVWAGRVGLDDWQDISYQLNQPTPILDHKYWRGLFGTGEWLLTLDWPDKYPIVARAFENHRLALGLLTQFLFDRMTAARDDVHEVDDPHHRIEWDPQLYERLLTDRQVSCSGIWLLTLEATRSINFVITAIRAGFDPFYRFDEGLALVADGDVIFGAYLQRVEYASESELLPPRTTYSTFVSNLRSALRQHDSRYGRELELPPIRVGEWATHRDDHKDAT